MIVVTYGTAGEARELICAGHAGYAAEGGGGKRRPGRCQRQLPLHRGAGQTAAAGGGSFGSRLRRSLRMTIPPSTARVINHPCVFARTGNARPYGSLREHDPSGASRRLSLHRGGLRPAPAGGGDIVCAAASALCGGLAATLLKHKEDFASASVTEAAGYCRIACADEAAAPYFEFALVGLKKLAEAYPENVAVKLSDEREVSP